MYQVGYDNKFNFKPVLTVMDLTTFEDYVSDWDYNISIYLYEDSSQSYQLLMAENDYVTSLDTSKCDIDFSDAAVGKKFKISLYPKDLTEKQSVEEFTHSYEVEVVDGFNVYNAKELGYITNANSAGTMDRGTMGSAKEAWAKFRRENNLAEYYPKSLILHNDIKITANDIPSEYFWSQEELGGTSSESAIGSLKDFACIYYRKLADNDTFTLEGNYFTVNAEELPTVELTEDKPTDSEHIISHAQLFYFYSNTGNKAAIQNIKMYGNAQRSSDTKDGGGVIMCKEEGVNMSVINTIARCWYISFHADYAHYVNPNGYFAELEPTYLVESCRAYDNFTSFVYNWGSKMIINNSEFIQAGGPAIIQDYVPKEKDVVNEVHHIPYTEINNTNIISEVTGYEAWFAMHNAASAASMIAELSSALGNIRKTYLRVKNGNNYMNFICLNKDGNSVGPGGTANTTGSVKINNGDTNTVFDYGKSNEEFKNFFYSVLSKPGNATNPTFLTSTGGMCYTDGSKPVMDISGNILSVSNAGNMLTGEYLSIYYGMMQITLGYYSL